MMQCYYIEKTGGPTDGLQISLPHKSQTKIEASLFKHQSSSLAYKTINSKIYVFSTQYSPGD
jgi:hypothetical protein